MSNRPNMALKSEAGDAMVRFYIVNNELVSCVVSLSNVNLENSWFDQELAKN